MCSERDSFEAFAALERANDICVSQAGVLSGSLPQDAGGLRLDTKDDALNYANKLVERLHDWAVAQGVRAPCEDYLEAQCEILIDVQFASGRKPRDFKLVMQVIPLVDGDFQQPGRLNNGLHEGGGILEAGPDYCLMRGAGEVAHRPQNSIAIPSIVWLKKEAVVDEAVVNVHALPFHFLFEVFRVSSEWEIDSLCVFAPECNGRLTKTLVERDPQFFHDVGCEASDFRWEPSLESELNDLFSGLWVGVSDKCVIARLADRIAHKFKLGEAFFSAIE
jgi:hypothetical protein